MHFPRWLAEGIRAGEVEVPQPYSGRIRLVSLRPEDVQTLVLWSKDFSRLLGDEGGLRHVLATYDQLFCHLTITGLGGTALEPSISSWTKVVEQVPELIELVGDPRRVTVRFDPIVHWRDEGQQLPTRERHTGGMCCLRRGDHLHLLRHLVPQGATPEGVGLV
jgi:hypothetical protein